MVHLDGTVADTSGFNFWAYLHLDMEAQSRRFARLYTAERLYDHDNATRRTFDEAARHAEALFAAHDMSPARD
jgi:hypothetical protein